jgi:hypothetical protein
MILFIISGARMYIDRTLDRPDYWMEIVTALALLCSYCHQHARWLDGFTLISIMTRLAVPLKLNTVRCLSTAADSLIPPALTLSSCS